jgi:MFS family permease
MATIVREQERQAGWLGGISRYQWLVLFVAWLGWSLDATDFNLYSLVLRPAVTELLGGQADPATLGLVGGSISTVGLLGWAFGGFLFGMLADYIGRVKTLTISIAVFSVFTALQGIAQAPWQLGLFRFLGGLGTGAEIIVGIPLMAEVFGGSQRAKVIGIMMTGGAFGNIFGSWIYALVGPFGWRPVFFVGILPALLLILIRRNLVEPERFLAVRERRAAAKAAGDGATEEDKEYQRFVFLQLFSPRLRFNTAVALLFCLGTLLAIWTSQIWLATIQSLMLDKEGISGVAAIPYISNGILLWGVGGIFGYSAFGFIADAIGRRATIILYSVGTLAAGLYLYLGVNSYGPYPILLFIFGFFVFGVFSGHAIYIPELYPTYARATAVSFANGSGRVITSFGPLVAGLLVGPFGGDFNKAAALMTSFAILSIIAMVFGRETRGQPLPT